LSPHRQLPPTQLVARSGSQLEQSKSFPQLVFEYAVTQVTPEQQPTQAPQVASALVVGSTRSISTS